VSILNEKDMNFELLLRAEKGYYAIISIAQALFDLCWYVKLKGSLPWAGSHVLHPALESKIYKMAEVINGFAKPSGVAESIDFLNAFIEGREVRCRNRSTVEDFLQKIIGNNGSGK